MLQLLLMSWQRLGREDEARARLDAVLENNDQLHDVWLARLAIEQVGSESAVTAVERWMAAMEAGATLPTSRPIRSAFSPT